MLLSQGSVHLRALRDLLVIFNENTYDTASITIAITGEDFISHRGGSITTVVLNGYLYLLDKDRICWSWNVSDVCIL
jgi:hypothetical protein